MKGKHKKIREGFRAPMDTGERWLVGSLFGLGALSCGAAVLVNGWYR